MQVPGNICVREQFLDADLARFYLAYARGTDLWENNGDGIWNRRSLNLRTMPEPLRESMLDYRTRVRQAIQEHFALDRDLYSDIFQLVRWREGDCLDPPHADAEEPDGTPNKFYYRNYAAITYLNDDYEGGEIHFPRFGGFRPERRPGTLVVFPGTAAYLHGVSKVTAGIRYTIAGFFTFDQSHHDGRRI